MSYQLFIFDFDGTLADSGLIMADALNKAARRFGFRESTREELEALRGLDNRAVMRELGVPMWRLPQIAGYMRKLAREAETPPLFAGAAEMLGALAGAGCSLAVVSSNCEAAVRRALGPSAALFGWFACNAGLFGKAAKFRRVLKAARAPAKATIAIGDETRDIEAARAAGVTAGAVAWGYATPALLKAHAPDRWFETPAEIAALALTCSGRA